MFLVGAMGARGCVVKVLTPACRGDKPPQVDEYADCLRDANLFQESYWMTTLCSTKRHLTHDTTRALVLADGLFVRSDS